MNKLYMGIDAGLVMIKGVIIDKNDNVIASACRYTEGKPIENTKIVINELKQMIDLANSLVVAWGVTGASRKLIGSLINSMTTKNEITASVIGTLRMYPDVRTIFEIGGEDAKVIWIRNGAIYDYKISNSCVMGMGSLLDSLAKRLNMSVSDIGNVDLSSNKVEINSRCRLYMEEDLIHKLQNGYDKCELLNGLCYGIAKNYIDNVISGKRINTPIIFNGGVSKNKMIVKSLCDITGEKIIVNKNALYMGALGIAIMARNSKKEKAFDFNTSNYDIKTKVYACKMCSRECMIMGIYRNDILINSWGNKCNKKEILKNVNKGNIVV